MRKLASRPAATGVLLVDKPQGMTSHDVVRDVRRTFGQREVGHTGTLDPMATGLLVLALGRATRIARFIEACHKVYTGTVTLGTSTTTFDAEGDVTETRPVEGVGATEVEAALASLRGEIEQRVPAYSAVKVGGERLYAKARRGDAVETPSRRVEVFELEATRIEIPEIDIEARVSKGTYVRTLAVQIGEALGLPAHLSRLRRTRVGDHSVDRASSLEQLEGRASELIAMQAAVAHLPAMALSDTMLVDVGHGRCLLVDQIRDWLEGQTFVEGDPLALIGPDGELAAVGLAAKEAAILRSGLPDERAIRYACVLRPA